jgi:serine/threonine-protein kinase
VALTPGTRIGSFEITGPIGVGGRGEVYRATDTNLGRQVAIKVLPGAVAADAERLARFQREAEVLASLNHPNIAAIHGLEKSGGQTALVMELVEGPTLADRIAEGPIPVDEALAIARQMADALEAAHEQGIVHRDLKPANVKVRPDGTVKVLDFGLAKAMEPADATASGLTRSPTITSPAVTQRGVILGTAAYMSPEQARGRPVDRRADIWAFGVVLYELLTGRRAFEADDVSLTLARVLEREVDFAALPPGMPSRVMRTLRVCLLKDPRQRASAIHDVRLALDGAFDAESDHPPSTVTRPLRLWQRPLPTAALAVLLVALAGLAVWRLMPEPPARLARFVAVTSAMDPFRSSVSRDLAIAPDGTRLVYVAGDGAEARINLRSLDRLGETTLFRTRTIAASLFLSPDGGWVGFATAEDRTWRRVSVNGGPSITMFAFPGTAPPAGASWGPDGTIVFALQNTGLYLWRAEGGSEPQALTSLDEAQGEVGHRWPEILPGGQAVLFTVAKGEGTDNMQIAVLDLTTGDWEVLLPGGSNPQYARTGHVVYGANGGLWAVPFDLGRLALAGTPVPVLDGVMTDPTGAVEFSLSADGSLVYVPAGGETAPVKGRLVWRSRNGDLEPIVQGTLEYPRYLRLSPDGRRLALTTGRNNEGDLWAYDLDGRPPTPLTFDAHNIHPVWSPDATRVAFTSNRDGLPSLFVMLADASTLDPERLLPGTAPRRAGDWSRDNELLFEERGRTTRADILAVSPEGGEPRPVVNGPSGEWDPRLSPDNRWLAYVADITGTREVWVRAYPGPGAPARVSHNGGIEPVWARDGRELFYLEGAPGTPDVRLMSVTVETAGSFRASTPQVIVDAGFVTYPNASGVYDVAEDGRFMMIEAVEGEQDAVETPPEVILIQNWTQELTRLVPAD